MSSFSRAIEVVHEANAQSVGNDSILCRQEKLCLITGKPVTRPIQKSKHHAKFCMEDFHFIFI